MQIVSTLGGGGWGEGIDLKGKQDYNESAGDPGAANQKGHCQQIAHGHPLSLSGSPLIEPYTLFEPVHYNVPMIIKVLSSCECKRDHSDSK